MASLTERAVVHHGFLLPEERHLCESLFKRTDGVSVLAATSTLAQGMNLPSELVIIAEDSRFDQTQGARELLKAQELLNAAGRAGRPGENANGIVLVVPGKVIGINSSEMTIRTPLDDVLQKVLGQSDQCLDIDDPLTALLDRIHSGLDQTGELERYCVGRFSTVGGNADERSPEQLSHAIKSSLWGYKARRNGDKAWMESRISAAIELFFDMHRTNWEKALKQRLPPLSGFRWTWCIGFQIGWKEEHLPLMHLS